MKPYITISNMSCSIQNALILKNIDLSLYLHEFVALAGPNGSGKTTLGKAITGIIPIDSGDILIDEVPLSTLTLPQVGNRIGYLFQNPDKQIFAPTVYEELSFALKYKGIPLEERDKKVTQVIDAFELSALRHSSTFFLSQGEKQRLAIAGLFLNEPSYLILDEPTTGLDPKRTSQLGLLLKQLLPKVGIMMISHDMAFIRDHAHRLIEIEDGGIVNEVHY